MADAWSTVVVRESEWDEYSQTRALALAVWEGGRCPNCHNYDCLVPLNSDKRNVRWTQHDDRVFEVAQYRCLACGAADLIKRDWHKRHEKDEAVTGQALPADGRLFVVRPPTEEVTG